MQKKLMSVLGIATALILLTACAQDPPEEVKVKLKDGRTASCIVVKDAESGDVEEMVCEWPDETPNDDKDK